MLHTIRNNFLSVTISEEMAQLQSILGADGTEYLWQGDPKYWAKRAPNLFPYVGRLNGGSYYLDGERYEMKIHGIAPYRNFTLVSKEQTKLVFALLSDEETLRQYPREFAFRVVYELQEHTLTITYEVENRDHRTLLFGLGAHPGFNVPMAPGLTFEDYRARFTEASHPTLIHFDRNGLRDQQDRPYEMEQGTTIPLSHDLFENDAIVLKDVCREVTLESSADSHAVTVSFPQMRYVGLWHMPHTDAPYVCIEPWCSLPALAGVDTVFEQQPDLLTAAPGETYRNAWSITVR